MEAATFEQSGPASVGTARSAAAGMTDEDAQQMLATLREMAKAIGVVE
jgi:hypothetical protein